MISDLRGICLNLERDLPEESELGGAQFPRDRHTGNILFCTSRGGRGGGRGVLVGQEAQQVKTCVLIFVDCCFRCFFSLALALSLTIQMIRSSCQ